MKTSLSRFVHVTAAVVPTEPDDAGIALFSERATPAAAPPILPWFQHFIRMHQAALQFNPHLASNLRAFGQQRIGLIFPNPGDPTAEMNFASQCAAQGLDTSNLEHGFSADSTRTFLQLGTLLDDAAQTVDEALTAVVTDAIDSERNAHPNDPHLFALHWLQDAALPPLLLADVLTSDLQTLLHQKLFLQLPPDFQAGLTQPFQQTARSFSALYDQILGR